VALVSATIVPTPARQVSGLTDRGLAVALTYRLRQAVETLPPDEAAALLGELRELVSAYCPRPPRSAA
jgi:hypothetical protein